MASHELRAQSSDFFKNKKKSSALNHRKKKMKKKMFNHLTRTGKSTQQIEREYIE